MRARDTARLPAGNSDALDRSAALHPVLRLQRLAGNRAVQRLIQRDAVAEQRKPAASRPADQTPPPSPPSWFKLTSDQAILPGEPAVLPGQKEPYLAGRRPPYTEADRKALEDALNHREQENRPRQVRFVAKYAAAFAQLARDQAIESMLKKSIELSEESGWSPFLKFLSFVFRSAIVALFPEERLAEFLFAKGAEWMFELTSESIEEATTSTTSELVEHAKELVHQSESVSAALEEILTELLTGFDVIAEYRTWLRSAPLSALDKFRVPPRAADVSVGEIGAAAAGALASFLYIDEGARWTWSDYQIRASLWLDRKTGYIKASAWFQGPSTLAEALRGAPVQALDLLPLQIELRASKPQAGQRDEEFETLEAVLRGDREGEKLIRDLRHDAELFDAITGAWPTASPLTVTRNPTVGDGLPDTSGGSFDEQVYLAELASPGKDWAAILLEEGRGVGARVSPEPAPATAAAAIAERLAPYLGDGAELLVSDAVEVLRLGDQVREVGWQRRADWQKALDEQRKREQQDAKDVADFLKLHPEFKLPVENR